MIWWPESTMYGSCGLWGAGGEGVPMGQEGPCIDMLPTFPSSTADADIHE